jgi:hypothetical protein
MLFSGQAKANSVAFLLGILGVVIAMALFVWLVGTQDLATGGGEPSKLSS